MALIRVSRKTSKASCCRDIEISREERTGELVWRSGVGRHVLPAPTKDSSRSGKLEGKGRKKKQRGKKDKRKKKKKEKSKRKGNSKRKKEKKDIDR
jgi:hypothetical protein